MSLTAGARQSRYRRKEEVNYPIESIVAQNSKRGFPGKWFLFFFRFISKMSDKRSKIQSNFADSYKKKDPGINRRTMRAHRRSVERKVSRDLEVNKRRNLSQPQLSPVKEEPKKQSKTKGTL